MEDPPENPAALVSVIRAPSPETDTRTSVWEALHHLIRAVAYRLHTLCVRKGWAEQARQQVAQAANSTLTMLYWKVGERIGREILRGQRADYGEQIVATLSQQLTWSLFAEILPLKRPLEREYYAEICRIERFTQRAYAARTSPSPNRAAALDRLRSARPSPARPPDDRSGNPAATLRD